MANGIILLVEDDTMNMMLMEETLVSFDYIVEKARNGEDSIKLFKEIQFDLVIMDIQLPGMDGLSATRQVKENSALKEIPVVALTSHAMEGDEEKAKEAGCEGYISKPIDTRGFLETISGYVKCDGSQ